MSFADSDELIGGRQSCEWWIDSAEVGQMVEGEERGELPIIYAHFFVETRDRPTKRRFKRTCPTEMKLLYIGERAKANGFKVGMKSKGKDATYKWRQYFIGAHIYSAYWPLLDPIFKKRNARLTLEALIHAELVSLFHLSPDILSWSIGMYYYKEMANLRIIHQCKYLILADIMAMWPTEILGTVKTPPAKTA